jgi:excisionase family DNA binding protein
MSTPTTVTARIFNVTEAADRLRVHPVTVRRLVDKGQLRAARIGDLLRIREEDLQALFEVRQVAK